MNHTPLHSVKTYTPEVQEQLLQKSHELGIVFAVLVTAYQATGENMDLLDKSIAVSKAMDINVIRVAGRLKAWWDSKQLTLYELVHYFPEAELQYEQRRALFNALMERKQP